MAIYNTKEEAVHGSKVSMLFLFLSQKNFLATAILLISWK